MKATKMRNVTAIKLIIRNFVFSKLQMLSVAVGVVGVTVVLVVLVDAGEGVEVGASVAVVVVGVAIGASMTVVVDVGVSNRGATFDDALFLCDETLSLCAACVAKSGRGILWVEYSIVGISQMIFSG